MSIEDVLPTPPEGWKWKTSLVQKTEQDYIRVALDRKLLSEGGTGKDMGFVPSDAWADGNEASVLMMAEAILQQFYRDQEKFRRVLELAEERRKPYEHLLTKR